MTRVIDKFKSSLVLDDRGRWIHHGQKVTNPQIARFFHNAIQKDEHGEYFLVNAFDGKNEHVYFEMQDTAYFVTDLEIQPTPLVIIATLNTDDYIDLDPRTFQQDERGVVYAWVKDSDRARLTDNALLELSTHVIEDGDAYCLVCGQERFPIAKVG